MGRRAYCCVCGQEREVVPTLAALLRCRRCGMIFADVALDTEELQALYGARYFDGEEYEDYRRDEAIHRLNARRKLRRLRRHAAPGGHLLELGAAHGFFMAEARALWSCRGYEISATAAEHGRRALGLDIVTADLRAEPPEPSRYDVAVLWDTVEHLERPDVYLALMVHALRPGGVLALTTGDIDAALARWQGARWRQIHPPTHLSYFSRRTLGLLLGRLGCHVLEARPFGMYRSLSQTLYSLFVLGRAPGAGAHLHAATRRLGLGRLPVFLDVRDLMFVISRKGVAPQRGRAGGAPRGPRGG